MASGMFRRCAKTWRRQLSPSLDRRCKIVPHGLSMVLRGQIVQVARDCCGNTLRVGDGRLGLVTLETVEDRKIGRAYLTYYCIIMMSGLLAPTLFSW
jgi:hypothetical protein